jgi:hypothetical protein
MTRREVPLTAQQEIIWFAEQLSAESGAAYNSVIAVDLPALEPSRLRVALQETVHAQPILGARAGWSDGGDPVQVYVDNPGEPVLDLLPECDNLMGALRVAGAAGGVPFDTETDNPIKWLIVPYPGGRLLAQVEHHYVHDGWSTWLVLSTVAGHYSGSPMPTTVISRGRRFDYSEYARWQRGWLGSTEAHEQADYWVARLANAPTSVGWPFDGKRPPIFSGRGGVHEMEFDDRLGQSVAGYAALHGATAFAVLLAAFAVLVGQECRRDSIVVGTMLRNRSVPDGTERTVGMFVNTVALPLDVSMRYDELAREISGQIGDAHDNEEFPFVKMVRRLATPRDLSRNAVFQVCFSMNDYPQQTVDFGDGARRALYPMTGGAKFDLDVVVLPEAGRMRVLWRYYSALFTAADVEALAGRWVALLAEQVDQQVAGSSPCG